MGGYYIKQLPAGCGARSAFYQSGGAYGFRDQLQDTMNILPIFPQASREQILINCAHQF